MNWKEHQQELNNAIQEHSGPMEAGAEGSFVTKWLVVAEFMDPNGEKWLALRNSEGMTTWDRNGMLHDALFDNGQWTTDTGEDDS